MYQKKHSEGIDLTPMTLEGCVVRLCDTIAYIGRDIEDAIELKLIKRSEIPGSCRKKLGDTNGTIVYHLVEDLITNTLAPGKSGELVRDAIGFSPGVSESLQELKKFNYSRIYMNPVIKRDFPKIQHCYRVLFETYLDQVVKMETTSEIFTEMLDSMGPDYIESQAPAIIARDFIAGMTDDYFLKQAAFYGCPIPEKI